MNTDKPFKTIDEQMELLESRNLLFENKETVRLILTRYGYYEIINGYKDNFLKNPNNDDDGFKPNTTFEHIYALYKLDKNIRSCLKNSLEDFELSFKQILAYTIAEAYSDKDSRYVAKSHYNAGKSHRRRRGNGIETDRDRLLRKMNNIIKYNDYQPYKHYREDHNNIPPWIAIKGLTFGESVFLFKLSKRKVRDTVISKMLDLGLNTDLIPLADKTFKIRQAFGDVLALALYYRNLTSHGGRIYNRRTNRYRLRYSNLLYPTIIDVNKKEFRKNKGRSSVGTLLCCLRILKNEDCRSTLASWLQVYLGMYLKLYPDDKNLLVDSLELNLKGCQINLDS